jgi:outer membrane lipoprotein-sorting protein
MRFFIAALFLMLAAAPALAADVPEVKAVEAYLNGISTLQARFAQSSTDGGRSTGDFMLKRPGRMRFQYDAPLTDFIVADGTMLYYYDGQMKQQSNTPISLSLANFFLRKNLKLSGDIGVSDVRRDGGLLHVTVVESKDPLAGSLTLTLTENPMQLQKWRVVDPQGGVTDVALSDIRTGIALKDTLFRYVDPVRAKPNYN